MDGWDLVFVSVALGETYISLSVNVTIIHCLLAGWLLQVAPSYPNYVCVLIKLLSVSFHGDYVSLGNFCAIP